VVSPAVNLDKVPADAGEPTGSDSVSVSKNGSAAPRPVSKAARPAANRPVNKRAPSKKRR
jgi:hypothetical protein